MAHFYGKIRGARGEASRLGTPASGLEVTAASWQGAIQVWLHAVDGVDVARVEMIPWRGQGVARVLYDGPVSGAPATEGRAE